MGNIKYGGVWTKGRKIRKGEHNSRNYNKVELYHWGDIHFWEKETKRDRYQLRESTSDERVSVS